MPAATGGWSAITAVGLTSSIGPQSGPFPPFNPERSRTPAFLAVERVLRALSCHFDFGKADAQRCRYEAARLRVVLRRPPGGVALTDMLSVTPIVPESID